MGEVKTGKVVVEPHIWEILVEYCEWSGNDVNDFVNQAIVSSLEADLDVLSPHAPKALEFARKLKQLGGSL